MPGRIQRELALLLTGKDVSWSKTAKGAEKTTKRLNDVGRKAGANVSRNIERGVVIGAGAATVAVAGAVNSAMEFESSTASVAKTVEGNVEAITNANRELAKTTGLDVNALNEISATAGALGVQKDDIDDFTKSVALLGVTTDDVTTELGATSLGHLNTTLRLAGDDVTHLATDLVFLGNNGASTEGQILSMAENIAGAAETVGASAPQVLGWAAAMANTGEEAEAGGSSIQRFWLGSFKNVQKGGKELKLMAKTAGMTQKQFKAAFGKDASGTLATFIKGLGKLDKATQLATLEDLGFTDIRITRALLKLLANTDNLTESLADSERGWEDNDAATNEAAKRFETTASKLEILKANVNDAAITIGTELLPVLADLSTDAVGWITAHQGDIKEFSRNLSGGVREAVEWAQKLDWDSIGAALQAAAGGARAIVDAFNSLDPDIKALLIGGFVLNKFTGGAITDAGKMTIEHVFDQFVGRGSSPVNPVFVQQVGGPVGAGLAPGGAGLTMASRVFLVGEAIGLALLVNEVRNGISDASTGQARGVRNQAPEFVRTAATSADLRNGLRGVEEGIDRIRSNPFLMLVQGQALTELQALRGELSAAVLAREERERGVDSTTAAEGVKGSQVESLTSQVEQTRLSTVTGLDGIKGAIQAKDLSVQVNNTFSATVQLSARDQQASITQQTIRSNGGSGDRNK